MTHEICDGPLLDFSNPSYYDIVIFKNGIKWLCKHMHHQISMLPELIMQSYIREFQG
jgi:hypothetical protein